MEARFIHISRGEHEHKPAILVEFHVEDKEKDTEHIRTFWYRDTKQLLKLPVMVFDFVMRGEMPLPWQS